MLCVFVLALFPAAAVAAPISFRGSTFYDMGSVPDCRVISQVPTVSGNVQCCDSCRTGLLLHPEFIEATKLMSESATSVDAATITEVKQDRAAPLPPAEAGNRTKAGPEESGRAPPVDGDDSHLAPEPEAPDVKALDAARRAYPTKISAQAAYHRAMTEESESTTAVVQMDVVSCNRCISPTLCLAQGMRINTWHRTCY
jgi:hypothetical protein